VKLATQYLFSGYLFGAVSPARRGKISKEDAEKLEMDWRSDIHHIEANEKPSRRYQ